MFTKSHVICSNSHEGHPHRIFSVSTLYFQENLNISLSLHWSLQRKQVFNRLVWLDRRYVLKVQGVAKKCSKIRVLTVPSEYSHLVRLGTFGSIHYHDCDLCKVSSNDLKITSNELYVVTWKYHIFNNSLFRACNMFFLGCWVNFTCQILRICMKPNLSLLT